MRFQTDKESREKTMNKILKQIKSEVKNIPTTDEDMLTKLQNSCQRVSSDVLFQYMVQCIDFTDEDSESKE